METVIELIAVMLAFAICFWLLLKYGDQQRRARMDLIVQVRRYFSYGREATTH